jgi:hypothetical protein
MYARVATFQGGDPARIDDSIDAVRSRVVSDTAPDALRSAKMLMLIDRASGKGYGITLYESEDAMHRGDEALNALPGAGGTRRSVEFFEVPVHKLD